MAFLPPQRITDIYDDLPPEEAREQVARERARVERDYAHQRCYVCDGVCIPTGTCHTCQSCGETTGCG